VFRTGHRASVPSVVVHVARSGSADGPRVGFAVGKQVGAAVTRNTVKRRLRHVVRGRLEWLPPDAHVVVRATPAAAHRTSAQLAEDVDRAVTVALRKAAGRAAR